MQPRNYRRLALSALATAIIEIISVPATAQVNVQCPGDTNGDAVIDSPDPKHPSARCVHLAAGDGYVRMADGKELYTFGFSNMTGVPESDVVSTGLLNANFPAPTIQVDQGDELYISLTNVGMLIRPDLFDPHTVHFHGFPNAAAVFDGLPDSGVAINGGATLTYYYKIMDPGTYMYHCHVEATEHMQMGMLGNLYVRAGQDKLPGGTALGSHTHQPGMHYAYNDGDGSTRYDVDYAIQIGSFDSSFHDLHEAVQPLPFALMRDTYPMLNGRGYPDTVSLTPVTPPSGNGDKPSQPVHTRLQAKVGQRVLLRISDLNVTRFYTLQSPSIPMRVVGKDARLLRGPDGKDLTYRTNSVTLGGGESADVILDTSSVAPGTYFLYAADLNYLVNHDETTTGMGGMMTEIRITAQ